jgi:putative ABC transport system permease protein
VSVVAPSRPVVTHPRKPNLVFGEIARFAYDTFCTNRVRFVLTAFGMVVGTASLILVVTIGLTGKQYVIGQLQAIGSNMVYVNYEGGANAATGETSQDQLTVNDMRAVREQVMGIRAASPMIELHDRISVRGGKERDILVLGVSPEYPDVRNLLVSAGRFFDYDESAAHTKVAIVTEAFAVTQFGSIDASIGHEIKLFGLPFTVIGVFRERIDTLGETEIADQTILIPYTVARFFTGNDYVKQIFFSMADAGDVPRATSVIHQVIQARHRSDSIYKVENLSELLDVAAKTANALTTVLLLVSAIALIVSGIGIMNIMLATVNSRIREIGVRKAVGATNREIKYQFLAEALFISITGGLLGIIIGLALPFSLRFLTSFRVPISGLSAIIAIGVSSLVGVIFGTVPATRAARLDPVLSLRHE